MATDFIATPIDVQTPLNIFLWDNPLMFQLDPKDPEQLSHALHSAARDYKPTLDENCQRLGREYGVSEKTSAISCCLLWQMPEMLSDKHRYCME